MGDSIVYKLYCFSLMVPFSLEFSDILNLFSLENRNYLKYGLKLKSLRGFSLLDTVWLPT